MPVFFKQELEPVTTFWRIYRSDGVTLGFTGHDRDLFFAGLMHRAAPGMVPSAIRRTRDLSPDSAEVSGAISHDSISQFDLEAGLFDEATIEIGAVNWESLAFDVIFAGNLGRMEEGRSAFTAELKSAKALLERDLVPRTSPTCRAGFCDKSCGLSAPRFTQLKSTSSIDIDTNRVQINGITPSKFLDGQLRFRTGPQTGLVFCIIAVDASGFLLDRPLATGTAQQLPVELREGCDHRFETCSNRFSNSVNFRGEPFLPGNDLLARYPKPQ